MSNFRTIEISDPEFETNCLRFVTVKSQNLKGRGDICMYSPSDDEHTNLPVLILLHGVYGSSWAWSMKGGVHKTANQLIEQKKIKPMIIAMPSDGLWGDGSAYLPHNDYNFEKWIAEDVIQAVKETIGVCGPHSSFFISGLSMGGYGAISIGAKYGKLFRGISAHSAITQLEEFADFIEEPIGKYAQNGKSADLINILLENKFQLPALRFDCGTADKLFASNKLLHEELQQNNIAHSFEALEGGHDWNYWRNNIVRTLSFVSELSD